MRVIFATLLTYGLMAKTLGECNHEDRLLSFYLLDKLPDGHLKYYVETGYPPPRKPRPRKATWKSTKYVRDRRLYLSERNRQYQLTDDTA